ncbi:MAG TPA: AAA family ATPase, partial [Polyangiales bacterium]|nr:AAA family ATPase [Polyangiales bacterium]
MTASVTIAGRYELQEKLGQGGMGSAYRALDRVTGRVVALKQLDTAQPKLAALFEREYYTLASLRHPCVVEVYDFGITEAGVRFYTMELLDGTDLSQLAPVPWRVVCQQLRDVATSLALLHARRLVHRDVSPRNVRIDGTGRAKLLDFGTITTFGKSSDVAGTPRCIAPEVIRGLPLDGRTDLFSLGVVAYWALTNRWPFSHTRLGDAESAWRSKPQAPSALVSDVPRALDDLVMSLLSVDPLGRPASDAELIARLVGIADLDDAPLEGLTHSHLSSCALIGRQRETAQLTQFLERARSGAGSVVLVEGEAGIGKSRLASEVTIHAGLLGLASLRVDAYEHSEPSGLVSALVRHLTEIVPAEAAETLPARPVLCQAFEALQPYAAAARASVPLPRDPLEQRALIHSELANWLHAIASRRPLVLIVDNAHAADLASAAALVTLAHGCQRSRMLFVATLLRDAPAPTAIQQLERIGARIRLRELPPESIAELTRSVFGDVPHLARLTSWIQRASSGVPGRALELLSQLTERGVIRYAGGAWALPAELTEADLPDTLDELLEARIRQLDAGALRLARLLALHRAAAPLTLCKRLVPELSSGELFGALDRLIVQQILIGSPESYRMRHEALRKLLVASLDAAARAELHRALGNAILADLPERVVRDARQADSVAQVALALQAGWHLLHAGEGARARALLRDAGLELSNRGEGFADAIPALQAALSEYERLGLSRYERAYLMVPLTLAGLYLDWRLAYRYGEPLIDLLAEAAGLHRAQRLRPWLGKKLALYLSLVWSFLTFRLGPQRSLARDFRELMVVMLGVTSPVIGNAASLGDGDRARSVLSRIEPLSWFPRGHLVRLIHDLYSALVKTAEGNYTLGYTRARDVLERLRSTHFPGVPHDARRQLEAGMLFAVGSFEAFRTDGSVHRTLEALDAVTTWTSRQSAAGIRANYYASRGERARYEEQRAELDVFAAQSGSTWRQDVLIPRSEWWTASLSEDVLGLKRAARKLEELAVDHPSLAGTRDIAQACYLAERGRAEEAVTRYGATLDALCRDPVVYAMRFVAAYARILRAAKQPERARKLCEAALADKTAADHEFTAFVFFVELEQALALSDLGARDRAVAELDRLIGSQSRHDNALVHGLAHRARAQVAAAQADAASFQQHLHAMQEWFARTANPALIAQVQRLADEGRRRGLLKGTSDAPPPRVRREADEVRRAFADKRGPTERLQLAVDLLTEKSGAAEGYLYLLEPGGLRFAAPMVGAEPPVELLQELSACVATRAANDNTSRD